MSGHSKWATIHRQKEVKDAKKGQVFTKLGNAITVAVKQGGGIGDAQNNFKLRLAIEKAKQFNMPKDNIARAIERGKGTAGEGVGEAVFEGFLPGGVAVLVECLTDNRMRTMQQVREILEKNGGSLGSSGSVGYLFAQKGELNVKRQTSNVKSVDEQELEMIDAGVDEVERGGESWLVSCERERLFEVRKKLEEMGYEVERAEAVMKPTNPVKVEGEVLEKIEKATEMLEDLDDVARVWTNHA